MLKFGNFTKRANYKLYYNPYSYLILIILYLLSITFIPKLIFCEGMPWLTNGYKEVIKTIKENPEEYPELHKTLDKPITENDITRIIDTAIMMRLFTYLEEVNNNTVYGYTQIVTTSKYVGDFLIFVDGNFPSTLWTKSGDISKNNIVLNHIIEDLYTRSQNNIIPVEKINLLALITVIAYTDYYHSLGVSLTPETINVLIKGFIEYYHPRLTENYIL